MRKYLLLIIFPGVLSAYTGRSGGVFLSRGAGARPTALCGAFTAIAEGPQAVFWNPAGIALVSRKSVSLTSNKFFAGITGADIAFVSPSKEGAVGISMIASFSGKIEITTEEQQEGTGHYYSANDYALGISYARRLTDKFNAGFTIKVYSLNIYKVTATGWLIDIGGTYNTGLAGNLRFGYAIRNFGPNTRYRGENLTEETEEGFSWTYISTSFPMPLCFQGGFAVDVLSSPKVTVDAEIVHQNDQPTTYAVGLEAVLGNMKIRTGITRKDLIEYGAGIGYNVGSSMGIDYTVQKHKYLGYIHRVAVNFEL